MMVILGFLIYNFNGTLVSQQKGAESSGSASAVMNESELFILSANSVLGSYTFSSSTHTSSSNALVLEIPSINDVGTIIVNAYDHVAFYTIGNTAYRIMEANASSSRVSGIKQLSSTVSALTFTYDNADIAQASVVTVDVQTRDQVEGNILSDHRHEQVRLRNR